MDFKQYAGVTNYLVDIASGVEVSWRAYMRRVIDKIGIDKIAKYLPYEISYLKEAYKKDPNFNTTPIRDWDSASGFYKNTAKACKPDYVEWGYGLRAYLPSVGITSFSPAECVSLLKEVARIKCEELCECE
jgi:hypothetical protein